MEWKKSTLRAQNTVIAFMLVLLTGPALQAQESENGRQTLSPYFFVISEDSAVDSLPLKSTSAEVHIAGVIADVKITQTYRNEGTAPLEAIYIFPGSTRAAVHAMQMSIGERVIVASVRARDQARKEYTAAKKQGKSASLLEQQRPNVFQMNVANIPPGDEIRVELKYVELLVPSNGVYEFVYPTVVGPRYSNKKVDSTPPEEHWIQNPYHTEGQPPAYSFDIRVSLSAGLPIQEIICPSHRVQIDYSGVTRSEVRLDPAEQFGGNRDFILRYRLSGSKIESGLLLYPGEDENFFLLMVQPPRTPQVSQISPREYIFIVDVSGSMHGFPLEISKKLLSGLIGSLRSTDQFNVLLFAGGSALLSDRSLPATSENISRAIQFIMNQRGGGGTEILPALRRALGLPRAEGFSRTIVIATDGYVAVEPEVFDTIREHLGEANLFPFGIGSSVNRHLIEGMAHAGMGEPFILTKPEEAPASADRFQKYIQSPVLTGIQVQFLGFEAYDVEPPHIPDVFAEKPVILFGKWRGRPVGAIRIAGKSGDGPYESRFDVSRVPPLSSNSALRFLWARHRIQLLADYNRLRMTDDRIQEITNLGLNYNLLTSYTSFVAIDSIVRRVEGEAKTVKQPLPLPQGVSNLAVGGNHVPTTPEPETWMLLLVATILLLWIHFRGGIA